MPEWKPFDRAAATPPRRPPECFICELVAGTNPHEVFYDDDGAVAFFPKFPVMVGHVHWHSAPLPAGIPFAEQQCAAIGRDGYWELTDAESAKLVRQLRSSLSDG
jgi:hypothetical protein